MADKSYVSKINGYYVKDAEAHGRLDTVEQKLVEGVGKIDEIHVNNTKIPISTDGKKSVNIAVDGTYNASTNKVATVKTVTEKVDEAVQGIMGDGVSQAYDTFKEMQDYISTHGSEAVGMANNITKNSQGIDALETAMDNLALEETYTTDTDGNGVLELEVGSGGTSSKTVKSVKLTDGVAAVEAGFFEEGKLYSLLLSTVTVGTGMRYSAVLWFADLISNQSIRVALDYDHALYFFMQSDGSLNVMAVGGAEDGSSGAGTVIKRGYTLYVREIGSSVVPNEN